MKNRLVNGAYQSVAIGMGMHGEMHVGTPIQIPGMIDQRVALIESSST